MFCARTTYDNALPRDHRSLPHRSPAYSPSSPAACGSVATWLSFADRLPIASRQYARRYELLFGRRLARAAPKPHFAPPYAVLADKSRIQSIESGRAFPAPYTALRPSRPFQVILVTAEALRFVERRRGRRSATAPPPNPAPPYAVLADVRPSASALSVRRVPDAAARTDGRRCLCSWTSRRPPPPRRSPAYSPSSPAARGSVAPWPSFVASPIAS